MKLFLRILPAALLAPLLTLASCSTLPEQPASAPRPVLSEDPPVMGAELVPLDQFLAFVEPRNPAYGSRAWTALWQSYRDACQWEGVSHAVALTQMVHETAFQKYGGTVHPSQNNFAGLGTVDVKTPGLSFPDVQTGALAHVQHLKAYGSTQPLSTALVDPRFKYVKRGSAPTVKSLTKKWAADPDYGDKLMKYYRALWGANS